MMKKIMFFSFKFLLICLIFVLLCSCSNSKQSITGYPTNSTLSKSEIISDEKYYKIIKNGNFEFTYFIYDDKKKVVEETVTDNPLNIKLLNNNVVDVSIGKGTGLSEHHYYSVDRDTFSKNYFYVVAYNNEKIAYIDVPNDNAFENRRLVVRNVFDKSVYYQEYKIDFSKVDTPVICASFINNDSQLQITYLSGEQQTEITKVIDLTKIG